ncbi:MAG: transposase, partial [Endozoicomonadaceae bacterium]|nr:transposase [Endozoicomonadaceae bacterium]
ELIREQAKQLGMEAMIPKRSNTKKPAIHFKKNIYKSRHLVENLFARLKHFRSISTRFDKLARNFKAMIYIVCAIIWVNSE